MLTLHQFLPSLRRNNSPARAAPSSGPSQQTSEFCPSTIWFLQAHQKSATIQAMITSGTSTEHLLRVPLRPPTTCLRITTTPSGIRQLISSLPGGWGKNLGPLCDGSESRNRRNVCRCVALHAWNRHEREQRGGTFFRCHQCLGPGRFWQPRSLSKSSMNSSRTH